MGNGSFWNIANTITTIRMILVLIVVYLVSIPSETAGYAAVLLTVLAVALDYFDGLLGRKFNSTSDYGAAYDIVGDRVTENVFWLLFAVLGLVPVWIPVIVLLRSFIIDSLRSEEISKGKASRAFDLVKTDIGKALVSSRASRGLIGLLKLLSFSSGVYIYMFGATQLVPAFQILAACTVTFCVIRGIFGVYKI
jgi:CDP-diacylglycerol--glycerol-3-phosphate 3-phosphatidyltransferase